LVSCRTSPIVIEPVKIIDFTKYVDGEPTPDILLDMLKDYNLQLLEVIQNRQILIEQIKAADGNIIKVIVIDTEK
jgi:hypothetical protein